MEVRGLVLLLVVVHVGVALDGVAEDGVQLVD